MKRKQSGVTLLEVLFAIAVASVGMLGAVAVFPVAMAQARKGQVADMTAVAAQTAIHTFDAAGMRAPNRWRYFFDDPSNTNDRPLGFTVPYNPNHPRAFAAGQNDPQGTPFGPVLCIDPRGFEQNRLNRPQDGSLWSYFPAVPDGTSFNNGAAGADATTWGRMLRLTLNDGSFSGLPMSFIHADQAFRIEDQLSFERPDDNSIAAQQLFTQLPLGGAGRRQEEGRITWMATLSPKIDQPYFAADDIRSLPDKNVNCFFTNSYALSMVMFYDRTPDMIVPDATNPDRLWPEWTATIRSGSQADPNGGFFSSGIGGGEVRLYARTGYAPFNTSESLDVRRGSWIALSRTVPVANRTGIQFGTTPTAPAFLRLQHLQWYRVSDGDEVQLDTAGDWFREITLIGPDWPVDLFNNSTGNPGGDGIAEECDVIIVPNIAHVSERTISLEN